VAEPVCKPGEILAGTGAEAPLTCVTLDSLSLATATHAVHATEVDHADRAKEVVGALVADRALSLAFSAPLVLGTDAPLADVAVQVEGGSVLVDGSPLVRHVLERVQDTPAVSGTASKLVSTTFTPSAPGVFRFEASGSVGGPGKLDGTSASVCQILIQIDNVATSTLVTSLGSATSWRVSLEVSLDAAPYEVSVDVVSQNGQPCEEDPAGGTYNTQPAVLSAEVVGA
jgi:hypothetical protein